MSEREIHALYILNLLCVARLMGKSWVNQLLSFQETTDGGTRSHTLLSLLLFVFKIKKNICLLFTVHVSTVYVHVSTVCVHVHVCVLSWRLRTICRTQFSPSSELLTQLVVLGGAFAC